MSSALTLHRYSRSLRRRAERFNKNLPLAQYLIPFLPARNRVRIADLGSGPVVRIGNIYPKKRITIFPSDMLAREYNYMLTKRGIKPLIHIEYQNMEALTYPDNFFDIIHCVNAIDHTSSPDKALHEMKRTCRVGGYIYLRHYINEGEKQNYRGLHAWNLELRNNDCRFWRPKSEFYLASILPGATTVTRRLGARSESVVSIFRKV